MKIFSNIINRGIDDNIRDKIDLITAGIHAIDMKVIVNLVWNDTKMILKLQISPDAWVKKKVLVNISDSNRMHITYTMVK